MSCFVNISEVDCVEGLVGEEKDMGGRETPKEFSMSGNMYWERLPLFSGDS